MKIDRKELFKHSLALILVGIAGGYLFYITTIPKTMRSEDVGEIKVAMITLLTLVANYFFGSSQGSARNAETIRNMVNPSDGTTTVTTKSPTPEGTASETKVIT